MDKLVPEAGNLAGFIDQFPVFASAPGGIEKIKEMVLQLAVMGKLVENSLKLHFSFG
ncbi:hypothetical protein [Methyloprofundus sedimenti]|uniref:hypothetical protein n=1 Tax=Methyloprofundus sedimenti TaxID=1420851 RepID=UPI001E453CA7|nr:hypothetical protein [Methyloprofundus sedimenti]